MPKSVQTTICTIALISHARKVMLKIFRAKLQQSMNWDFQMYKLDLEKAEVPEVKVPTSAGSWKKAREFQKNIYFCFIDYAKAFVWITANWGKFFKRWGYQTTLPVSWETYMQVNKQQLEMDMEQQTGSKLGKGYIEAAYCYSAYLTSMQSTSCECWAGWSTSWNRDYQENYQQLQTCRWYHSNDRKWRASWWG